MVSIGCSDGRCLHGRLVVVGLIVLSGVYALVRLLNKSPARGEGDSRPSYLDPLTREEGCDLL